MFGHAEAQAVLPGGGPPRSDDVSLRTHNGRVPAMMFRIPEVEIVVVAAHRDEIFGAGRDIFAHQRVGIEMLGLPQGNDVLVAELRGVAVCLDVMVVVRVARHVHEACVPVALTRHRLRAPMRPDAELRVAKPIGRPIGLERRDAGVERSRPQVERSVFSAGANLVPCCTRCRFKPKNRNKRRYQNLALA